MKPPTIRILFILILVLPTVSLAQADSVRAAKLYAIGERHYSIGNIDSCYFYFEKTKDLFKQISPEGYGFSLYKIGLLDRNKFGYDKAIERFNEVVEIGRVLSERDNNHALLMNGLQEVGYAHMISKRYAKSNSTLKQLLDVCRKDSIKGKIKETWTYGILIWNYTQTGGFDSAVYYSDRALVVAEKLRSDTARSYEIVNSISSAYSGVGNYYGRIGHFPNFEKYHVMQYDFLVSEFGKGHRLLMQPLLGLGNLAFINSNHREALDYYDKALFIANAYKDTVSYRYTMIHDRLRQTYAELEEWDKALFHNAKAMKVYERFSHLNLERYKSYAARSRIYAIIGNYSGANQYLRLANEAFNNETDNYFLNAIAIAMVGSLSEMGEIKEAIKLSKKSLAIGKDIFPEKSFELSQNYHALASLHMKNDDLSAAYKYLDSARFANTREDSSKIYSQITIDIHALEMSLLLRELNSESIDLDMAISTIRDGQEYVSQIKSNLESDLGQVYEPNFFYNNSVIACASIFQATSDPRFFKLAFELTENDRSFDLKRFIRKADMLNSADVPKELETERKTLLDKVVTLKYEISSSIDLSPREELALREAYDQAKSDYNNILTRLKDEAPTYYQYNYQINTTSFEELEIKLNDSNTILLSYYVTDSTLVAFGLDGQNRTIQMIPWDQDLKTSIMDFRKSLKQPESEEYIKVAKRISDELLNENFPSFADKDLIILPHDILNYIPFELLSTNDESFLFEQNLIRYEYSADTYMKSNQLHSSTMLAMSPQFQTENQDEDVVRSELASLPGATEEVQELSKILSAKTILGYEATESAFREIAKNYGILHMATHAILDDENPDKTRLVFSLKNDSLNDGYLHSYEIYNLVLNADLVTLSACNTGFGKIKKGEGVMSLSRAFAYVGVPSTVVSLWPASDKSTPELMKYFYQNLKDGQTKDVALNNARKSYLATAQGKARHPFYWGGFVLIGDNSPIQSDRNLLVYLIPSILVFVMILTVYKRRKRA